MKEFSINKVSNILNVSQHTLRYYEKLGIINVARRGTTNIRVYSQKDIEWLKYIIALKDIGFSLEDIKNYSLLKKDDSATLSKRRELLKNHHTEVSKQIKLLIDIKKNIEDKISCIDNREDKDENWTHCHMDN